MLPEGRVVQSIGGYHTVLTEEGSSVVCIARGRLRRGGGGIVVGDIVRCDVGENGSVIEAIRPRRNCLMQPLVANVDQAALVFALHEPEPNLLSIDRFLVGIMAAGFPLFLCLNKTDLVQIGEAEALGRYYRDLGFTVVPTSARTKQGHYKLLSRLHGQTTVFCGPSGVGKSALLNMVRPGSGLVTGELSAKTRRGRHTTRAVRLLPVACGGFVVDTPGYSQVDLGELDQYRLAGYFPEFKAHGGRCRFGSCLHLAEPDCSIKTAVAEGRLPRVRYEHYCSILAELAEKSRVPRRGDRR